MAGIASALHLVFDKRRTTFAMASTVALATKNMANDGREKTVNYIMGNRKSPNNPFPKNVVNPKTGRYVANSVARKHPKPPKSYAFPGKPVSIAQVKYETNDKRVEKVGFYSIPMRSYKVGPIAGGKVAGAKSVPWILEHGGTTRSAWREIKKNGKTVRWEFKKEKPKPTQKAASHRGARPARYNSWRDVNQAMRAQGKQVGGVRRAALVAQTPTTGPQWNPPKTFIVRPRPYLSRARDRVIKRASRFLNTAAKRWPLAWKTGKYFEVAA